MSYQLPSLHLVSKPSHYTRSTHPTESKNRTLFPFTSHISDGPLQRHSNHESNAAYVNQALAFPHPAHCRLQNPTFPFIQQGAQAQSPSRTSDLSNRKQIPQFPCHGDGPRPWEEAPLYVNPKQFARILKRRTARYRMERLPCTPETRKPYLHESRHKHASRRPRGPGGRFLPKNKPEVREQEVHTGDTVRLQALETGTGLGRKHVMDCSGYHAH